MIFKKHFGILIAFFILLSQTGLAFSVHFCNSNIASITLHSAATTYQNAENCCAEVAKESKCCHNKIIKSVEKSDSIFVKIVHFAPECAAIFHNWLPVILKSNIVYSTASTSTYYCDLNAPPIFKLYCQYVLYA